MVVRAQFEQARMKENPRTAPLQYGTAKIVIENHAGLAGPGLKGMDMATQKVFHRLIEEELQIQRPRVGQRHHEAGKRTAGAAHHHLAEVRPIDLRLFAGKHPQPEKRLTQMRTQPGHCAPRLHHAAGVTAIPRHVVDPRRAQAGMLVQCLADERCIRINQARA